MIGATLAWVVFAVFIYALGLFLIALIARNNTVADIGWGGTFLLATLVALYTNDIVGARQVLVTMLVAIWSVRLIVHMFVRSWGAHEDWRYAEMRKRWGEHWLIHSFLRVFVFQGFLAVCIALPVLWVNTYGGPALTGRDALGFAVWLFGFLWEVVADYQLARFRQNPKNAGKILTSGLWKYSRHPNYFGEVTQWWGMYLIALSVPGAGITFIGPLLITLMLSKLSGLERRFAGRPAYARYRAATNTFLPFLSWLRGRRAPNA